MADLDVFLSLLVIGAMTSSVFGATVYVHELYAKKENTNRSVACGVCEARQGYLARRPELDDWEILFGNWSHLENMAFWIDLIKTDKNEWYWGDGQPLDLNQTLSLPMTPAYNQTYSGCNCAMWNMAEPFLMPADCSLSSNVMCQVPTTTAPQCEFSRLNGSKFDASVTTISPASSTDMNACIKTCEQDQDCWAVQWQTSVNQCQLLKGSGGVRPAIPVLVSDLDYDLAGKTCTRFEEMSEEESDFVCNCGAIEIPETEEEKEQFLEEHKEEVKKELIVPTETLSATIRKKESAPDERTSSTSIGYLGITMMVVVFGGLILMDVGSLFSHIKIAATNVKGSVPINGEEGASDA